jgi:c-di-GMP-binding flagellar brake protein YcgR
VSYRKKLITGLSVDLHVLEGEFQGDYKTHVDEVGQKRISVFAPNFQGGVIPLREGTRVEIIFWDDVSSYQMESVIVQRIAVPVPILVLEFPDDIRRIQRRNFVRIAAFYPVSYQVIEKTGLSNLKNGSMLDLSGGGMRFQTREKLDKGAILYAYLELPSGKLGTAARVCRVDPIEDTHKFSVSVDFYQINERDRDRIIRCVFDIQREMRKKGLV